MNAIRAMGMVLAVAWLAIAGDWSLPKGTIVKDHGPRTYTFTVDYFNSNTQGKVVDRQRVTAEYTRGLPGGDVVWKNVAVAQANGAEGPFGAPQKRDFMEGFRYHKDSLHASGSMAPDFFKSFPATAVQERNLVWDEEMIEWFGQDQFDHLKLNQPYHLISNEDTKMPGVGNFQNHDVQLVWTGRSQRNGVDCAVIEYRAYFNPIQINNGGISLTGRSHYWGLIWVSLATRQIEYATLYEDVLGELKLPNQTSPQVLNVFRSGIFEPLAPK